VEVVRRVDLRAQCRNRRVDAIRPERLFRSRRPQGRVVRAENRDPGIAVRN